MIDRPLGTPMVTRDGVSIASEIELHDRFENMGAQVVREVSMQTNEIAGDGTTTAIVLANALVQGGIAANERGVKSVDLCKGIDLAVDKVVEALKAGAKPAKGNGKLAAVANIAATDPKLGALVAEAYERVGADGIITTDFSVTIETTLDVVEGMSFERGYLSHHMVTNQEKMEAVLERPLILMTDLKIREPSALDAVRRLADRGGSSAADRGRGSLAGGGRDIARQAGAGEIPGGASAGIWPLAQGDAGRSRDPDRRPGDRPRSRRPD